MKRVYKVLSICLIVLGLVCPGCKPSSTAQLEENKAIVRRAFEEMGKQNWAAFMELHAPDFVCHTPGSPKPLTREELEKSLRMIYAAFPDFSPTIEDIIAEGDKVVIRETCRGTNKGEFMGTPATGKEITLSVTIMFRIAGGKIVEAWEEYDRMSLMQQLGAIPSGE
jgi:steroid delta-isomerase-like uncharacterized protein